MTSGQSTHLQLLLDRLRQGDPSARNELIGDAYDRLRFLARKMLRREFPRLQDVHGPTSVVHRSALRLIQALEKVQPATVRDFFNLAARHMRWALLDLANLNRRKPHCFGGSEDSGSDCSGSEPIDGGDSPEDLAVWEKFHRKVEDLPPDEREVFEWVWYHGRSQAELAELLGVQPKEVSNRWLRARVKLKRWVPELQSLVPTPEGEANVRR